MKLTDRIPAKLTWIIRLTGWSVSLIIIWGMFSFYANLKTANSIQACMETLHKRPQAGEFTSLDAAKELVACLDGRSGFPEKLMNAHTKKLIQSLPSVPCRYVGIWTTSRADTVYRVTLMDDSRYIAVPLRDSSPGAGELDGSWGVLNDRMVWLNEQGRVWPPDINQITQISDTVFTLREVDRSTTRYELVERIPSTACSPDPSPQQVR
jgi:hypothetical protein